MAAAGEADPEKWLGRRPSPGQGLAGRAVLEGHAVWTPDLLSDPRLTLSDFSHERIQAEGGAEGTARLAEDEFDLVLTDLGMPGISGLDAARAVKIRCPSLPVVLLTGWGDQAAVQADGRGLVDRLLAEPCRLEDLLRAIEELTGEPPAGRPRPGRGGAANAG